MITKGGACSFGPFPIPTKLPVTVPADFVGMHFRHWPIVNAGLSFDLVYPSTISADPAVSGLGYGSVRLHDSGFCNWYQLEPSQGLYNWTNLDTLITKHRTNGKTVVFCLLGTPQFYIANSNPNKSVQDWYHVNGGHCYPGATVGIEGVNGLTGLSNFITALVTRYNSPSGVWRALNPTLGKGIAYLEGWNEGITDVADVSPIKFFKGTMAQLVDMAYTVKTAAKAVDSAITVLSPSGNDIYATALWLNTYGTINTTKKGSDGCDAVALHRYNFNLPGEKFANHTEDILNGYYRGGVSVKKALTSTGNGNIPVYISESGIGYDPTVPTSGVNLMQSASPKARYLFWARALMIGAAFGYKTYHTYSWETNYSCYPVNDPDGIQKAINLIHSHVSGKTITAATYIIGGEVKLTFSDQSVLTV